MTGAGTKAAETESRRAGKGEEFVVLVLITRLDEKVFKNYTFCFWGAGWRIENEEL